MRWPFADWGADAVLAGHEHVYERLMIDDIPYFVNGLGGGGRYWFDDPLPGSAVRFSDDHGAMFVTASEEKITFEFVTQAGEWVDVYTLLPRP